MADVVNRRAWCGERGVPLFAPGSITVSGNAPRGGYRIRAIGMRRARERAARRCRGRRVAVQGYREHDMG